MRVPTAVRALLPLAFSAQAHGQLDPEVTITYSIVWDGESSPSSPSVKGAVWATISPEVGTAVTVMQFPYFKGSLAAFASSIFDVNNAQNGATGMLAWTVPSEFNVANLPGIPDGTGGIQGAQAGQFPYPKNPSPVINNAVELLELEWSTSDFGVARFVEFTTSVLSCKAYVDIGLSSWIGAKCTPADGSGGFWVVPAPSGMALMGLAGVAAARRRRE